MSPNPQSVSDKDLTSLSAILYQAHGKWQHANGKVISCRSPGSLVRRNVYSEVRIKSGALDGNSFLYIHKTTCLSQESIRGFLAELYLYSTTGLLRDLQGDIVPHIISATSTSGGRLTLNTELPCSSGWHEIHECMSRRDQEAVVRAYKKLHKRGILHGSVHPQHILIDNDGRVTILQFRNAKVVSFLCRPALETFGIFECESSEMELEMRHVKFILDYDNARSSEFSRSHSRELSYDKTKRSLDSGKFFRGSPDRQADTFNKCLNTAFPIEMLQRWTKEYDKPVKEVEVRNGRVRVYCSPPQARIRHPQLAAIRTNSPLESLVSAASPPVALKRGRSQDIPAGSGPSVKRIKCQSPVYQSETTDASTKGRKKAESSKLHPKAHLEKKRDDLRIILAKSNRYLRSPISAVSQLPEFPEKASDIGNTSEAGANLEMGDLSRAYASPTSLSSFPDSSDSMKQVRLPEQEHDSTEPAERKTE